MPANFTSGRPRPGRALVVFALVILMLGRRAALAAGALAMVAGFAVANYRYMLFPWWPEEGEELAVAAAPISPGPIRWPLRPRSERATLGWVAVTASRGLSGRAHHRTGEFALRLAACL